MSLSGIGICKRLAGERERERARVRQGGRPARAIESERSQRKFCREGCHRNQGRKKFKKERRSVKMRPEKS